MAALAKLVRSRASTLCKNAAQQTKFAARCMASESDSDEPVKESWFKRMLTVRRIDPGKQSHSQLLADKDVVYELQIQSVKPEFMETYLKEYYDYIHLIKQKETGAELVGSWTVEIGEQDEAIHIWKYPGGYPTLNKHKYTARNNQEFVQFRLNRNKMLRARKNQILLPFSFWPEIKERTGPHIYELRSYQLKPGTMIEWGNNWARGINYRGSGGEAVAGFFSQIGDLYMVQHLWAYESLQNRKEVREAAWRRPGWDEVVAYTVPLIRRTQARILIPTPFSPLQ